MNFEILPGIDSPKNLRSLNDEQLTRLTAEIREALCNVVSTRSAHFASNLGVVELTIAIEKRPSLTSISSATSRAVASKNSATSGRNSWTSREPWLERSTLGC